MENKGMGIYVHVPFCRAKCFYCGFYSVAAPGWKADYVEAVTREIAMRGDYLPTRESGTLYLGGGTPSCLERKELERIVEALERHYTFAADAERTIEANPEDLTGERPRWFRELGFNRLSVGVQSFSDERLRQINRRHTGRQAMEGIRRAAEAGFDNIGMDLIIGLPGQTEGEVMADLETVAALPVTHLSVYMLSVDPGTVFEKRVERGEFRPEDEEVTAERYREVCRRAREMGFEHYEISNFARDGRYSRHNTGYWQQRPYVGFGPSAHSYDGLSRQWNTANVRRYVEALGRGELPFEREVLTPVDMYNEFVMTGLRTRWGIDPGEAERRFGACWRQAAPRVASYLASGDLELVSGRLRLTEAGCLVSDMVMSDLFAAGE
ncbi:MAG: radical SAM family heme chaperone HemW [Marinifilaceae bacterium]|nr:radical SAM family heme chaperone HemW [Marinifilaceae bacterium]